MNFPFSTYTPTASIPDVSPTPDSTVPLLIPSGTFVTAVSPLIRIPIEPSALAYISPFFRGSYSFVNILSCAANAVELVR